MAVRNNNTRTVVAVPQCDVDELREMQSAAAELRELDRRRAEIVERLGWPVHFWSRVGIGLPDECWEWQGSKNQPFGHGQFKVGGKINFAHRAAYEMAHGPIPPGMLVCHSCDNPPCCNPHHLWLGTKADNNRDCWVKGRRQPPPSHHDAKCRRGGSNPASKLTEAQVREIRSSQVNNAGLAEKFGVSDALIWRVRRGLIWQHII